MDRSSSVSRMVTPATARWCTDRSMAAKRGKRWAASERQRLVRSGVVLPTQAKAIERGAFTFLAGTAHAINWRDQQQRDPTEPGTWESTGPWGGRADVLVISPNFVNDGIVFTGEVERVRIRSQYGRGLFKSSDGGQTWRASSNGAQDGQLPP